MKWLQSAIICASTRLKNEPDRMIAKSDILILTIASALLAFTFTRSVSVQPTLSTASSQTGSMAKTRAQQAAEQQSVVVDSAPASNQTVSDTSATTLSQTTTNDLNESAIASNDFQQPEIIREAAFKTHVVKSGEYLSLLAQRYNTSVSTLQELNDLKGSTIYVGQRLVYPD